ncbi:hypothetical protein [Schlesneria sp. T3-172]|uniref:hypothetical protein n=1 Tax=Schlesneria sphaerica TaxID=3373610 RepID=UPI0037C74621
MSNSASVINTQMWPSERIQFIDLFPMGPATDPHSLIGGRELQPLFSMQITYDSRSVGDLAGQQRMSFPIVTGYPAHIKK